MSLFRLSLPCAVLIAIGWLGQVTGQQPFEEPYLSAQPFNAQPPHLVLQPPRPPKSGQVDEAVVVDQSGAAIAHQEPVKTHPHEAVHDHFLHADKSPRPVAIAGAARVPVWKTPYSYGHFGASRTRQWSLHHGHQQTYTQWTLR